jgi:hypothetical protein
LFVDKRFELIYNRPNRRLEGRDGTDQIYQESQ